MLAHYNFELTATFKFFVCVCWAGVSVCVWEVRTMVVSSHINLYHTRTHTQAHTHTQWK